MSLLSTLAGLISAEWLTERIVNEWLKFARRHSLELETLISTAVTAGTRSAAMYGVAKLTGSYTLQHHKPDWRLTQDIIDRTKSFGDAYIESVVWNFWYSCGPNPSKRLLYELCDIIQDMQSLLVDFKLRVEIAKACDLVLNTRCYNSDTSAEKLAEMEQQQMDLDRISRKILDSRLTVVRRTTRLRNEAFCAARTLLERSGIQMVDAKRFVDVKRFVDNIRQMDPYATDSAADDNVEKCDNPISFDSRMMLLGKLPATGYQSFVDLHAWCEWMMEQIHHACECVDALQFTRLSQYTTVTTSNIYNKHRDRIQSGKTPLHPRVVSWLRVPRNTGSWVRDSDFHNRMTDWYGTPNVVSSDPVRQLLRNMANMHNRGSGIVAAVEKLY